MAIKGTPILSLDDLRDVTRHQLKVLVEVPEMKVVHSVHLRIVGNHARSGTSEALIPLGQVLAAEIIVEHMRQWGHEETDRQALNFFYSIQASPEQWLIGGQRSARFSAKAREATVVRAVVC